MIKERSFTGKNPPEEISVNDKFSESKDLTENMFKIIKISSVKNEYKRKNNLLHVKHLDLVLTEKCSLKFKDCSNLMQYYAKPIDEDYVNLIKGLDKFMNSVDFVNEIRFIGGEPLLYKKIGDVM